MSNYKNRINSILLVLFSADMWTINVAFSFSILSSPRCPDWFWGPPSLLSNGYWGLFPWGVKRLGSEAAHSLPTSAEAKKTWI